LPLAGTGLAFDVPFEATAYTDTVVIPYRLSADIANQFFEERDLKHSKFIRTPGM
jgi:hypothetical protein